jgi:hypothetical protein
MEFEEQVTDVKLVIDTKPRVYVKWTNTEEGRDKNDCYERMDIGGTIIYINTYNRNSSVIKGHPFWDKLETMYNGALAKQNGA